MSEMAQRQETLPEDFRYTEKTGLTEQEAAEAEAAGFGNHMSKKGERTFLNILAENLFTLFNLINLLIAAALFSVGSYRNMLFLGAVVSNIAIGTIQEWRAQKTIRKLRLINEPSVNVIREGKEKTLPPEKTVKGDLTVLRSGDQVTADCVVTEGSGAAMEALLTGESDPVRKEKGSWLYSGSYITEGKLTAQMVRVGDESYAGRVTGEARKASRPKSVLMTEVRKLIRFDSVILVPLGLLLYAKQVTIQGVQVQDAVPYTAAAMIGMIPEGLVLLVSIAMAVGVRKLGKRGAMVQELNAIESLARADVLCLDKTGTITTGEMEVDNIEPVDAGSLEEAEQALSRFLGAFDDRSGTLEALRRRVSPGDETPVEVIHFTSEKKRSAACFSDGKTIIMGAPAFVFGGKYPGELRERAERLAGEGNRVLVLAESGRRPAGGETPEPDRTIALIALRDQLRKGVKETIRYFGEQNVQIRIISGDDPRTVSRLARAAGIDGWDRTVDASGPDVPEDIGEICEDYTVFGRVTPEQKKRLIQAMREKGHNVAMTGDGVNDIQAMKEADCSIAIAGGSDAARHTAQLTLLESDFTVMPEIVLEGRRVINNITRSASLFLTKTLFSILLTLGMLILPWGYPFQPIQLTLISSALVGIPGFFLALEPSSERISGDFLITVLRRALPGGAAVAICAGAVMALTSRGWDTGVCRTIVTYVTGVICLEVLFLACRPFSRNRIFTAAGAGVLFAFAALNFGKVFYLSALGGDQLIVFAGAAALGTALLFGFRRLFGFIPAGRNGKE